MRALFEELGWLPPAPADFAARVSNSRQTGEALRRLATHALGEHQLARLSAAIDAARLRGADLSPLVPFRLGIAGTVTLDYMPKSLVATAARHGIALECVTAPMGEVLQSAANPESTLRRGRLDAILLALDAASLGLVDREARDASDGHEGRSVVDAALAHVDTVCGHFAESGIACLVQTLAAPPESLLGSLDAALPSSARWLGAEFNRGIVERSQRRSVIVVDTARIAETVGLADWHDPTLWNLAMVPFHNRWLPLWSDVVCRVIAAMRGKSRRCLVLDLDNTIWGGIVGDDGVEGLVIGAGDATGQAFVAVQRMALALRSRGVVLAVREGLNKSTNVRLRSVSKNEEQECVRTRGFEVIL